MTLTSEKRSDCGLREVVVKVASEALLLLFPDPFGFISVDGLELDSPKSWYHEEEYARRIHRADTSIKELQMNPPYYLLF